MLQPERSSRAAQQPLPEQADSRSPLPGGGDGGNDGGMEARVKRLEDDLKEIKGDLKTLLRDAAEMKGRLSGMPSTCQIVGIVGAMLALVIAGGGGLLAMLRYIQP